MKLKLSENIRAFRKERKMTQEKLAEALGVTVGVVYKWESGLSFPELSLLVEIADVFDTSVDVLLGYQMKNNRIDSILERIADYCRTLDVEGSAEAEKALVRYPHSFQIVYSSAKMYLAYGVAERNRKYLNRALELLERSIVLLDQNKDARISKEVIYGQMAAILLVVKEQDKGIELLKQNNTGGMFSSWIGTCIVMYSDKSEDAVPFIFEAYLDAISKLLTTITGYVFVYRSQRNWKSAIDITAWGIEIIAGVKTDDRTDFLDKALAELFILLAYSQWKAGKKEEAVNSLKLAAVKVIDYDKNPDYSLQTMRFVENTKQSVVFDLFGGTASASAVEIFNLLEEPLLFQKWKEILNHEQ